MEADMWLLEIIKQYKIIDATICGVSNLWREWKVLSESSKKNGMNAPLKFGVGKNKTYKRCICLVDSTLGPKQFLLDMAK